MAGHIWLFIYGCSYMVVHIWICTRRNRSCMPNTAVMFAICSQTTSGVYFRLCMKNE